MNIIFCGHPLKIAIAIWKGVVRWVLQFAYQTLNKDEKIMKIIYLHEITVYFDYF